MQNKDIMLKTQYAHHIGQTLKSLREGRGYTQKKIADVLNVSFQQIQKYETGSNRLPIESLLILKQFYDIPFDDFFAAIVLNENAHPRAEAQNHISKRLENMQDLQFKYKIYKAVEVLIQE